MIRSRRIRVVIVDDEIDARELVAGMLSKHPDIEVIGEAADGKAAVTAIRQLNPDLVFLDIQMPDFDGFEVIRQLGADRMPPIVFITAYDEYAINAFEVNALDYLLKPFSRDRFSQTVERAKTAVRKAEVQQLTEKLVGLLQHHQRPADSVDDTTVQHEPYLHEITVTQGNRFYSLSLDKVDFLESADHYVRLHTGGRTYLVHESISRLEQRLDPDSFARIHRTKIVRIKAIKDVIKTGDRAYTVVLTDDTAHRISRGYLDKLPRLIPGPE